LTAAAAWTRNRRISEQDATLEAPHGETPQESLARLRREVADLHAARERLVLAADAERRRLERRLHDSVQQDLVALAVELQLVAERLDAPSPEARRLLEEARRELKQTLRAAAGLADRVYPSLLDRSGLPAALRTAIEHRGLSVSVDVVAAGDHPAVIARTLFWCCLDLVEHLDPDERATFAVRDEGGALTFALVGESRAGASGDLQATFESLRDRVETLGGELTIEPGRSGAVSVSGSLPLSR
jgi:signal transduction histidine kinase